MTGIFSPVSLPPDTLVRTERGVTGPGPSLVANAPIASPAAIFGSHFACCVSLPYSISASVTK